MNGVCSAKALSKYTEMVDNLIRQQKDKLEAASDEARLRLREWDMPEALQASAETLYTLFTHKCNTTSHKPCAVSNPNQVSLADSICKQPVSLSVAYTHMTKIYCMLAMIRCLNRLSA